MKAEIPQRSSAYYLAQADLTLRRIVSPALWISAAVLLMSILLCSLWLLLVGSSGG